MTGCAIADCGRPARGRTNICERHHSRFRKTGSYERGPRTISLERVEAAWNEALSVGTADGPCLEWAAGPADGKNYGAIKRNGEKRATRALWVERHGPIPEGMHVLHRCDNPPCVRLAHLFLGTHAENMRDMVRKRRCAHVLSSEQVREIRAARAGGALCADLALTHGVTPRTIALISSGLIWREEAA